MTLPHCCKLYFEPSKNGEELSVEEIRAQKYGYNRKERTLQDLVNELREKIMSQDYEIQLLKSQIEEIKNRKTKETGVNTENLFDQSTDQSTMVTKSNVSDFPIYQDPVSILDPPKRRSTARLSLGRPLATLVEDSRETKASSSSSSSQEPSTFKRPSEVITRRFSEVVMKKANNDGSQPKLPELSNVSNAKKRIPFAKMDTSNPQVNIPPTFSSKPRSDPEPFELSLFPTVQHRGSMNFRFSEGFTFVLPDEENECFPTNASTPEKPLIII